jgi:hypothetical protein
MNPGMLTSTPLCAGARPLTPPRLAFGAWLALLVLSVVAFRRERRREPAFSAPTDTGISYANVHPSDNDRHDPYGDKSEFPSQDIEAGPAHGHERDDDAFGMPPSNRASGYGYGGVGGVGGAARGSGYGNANTSHLERPSVDAYGAFDGDMPGNREEQHRLQTPSRTMQMAYADPCEWGMASGATSQSAIGRIR